MKEAQATALAKKRVREAKKATKEAFNFPAFVEKWGAKDYRSGAATEISLGFDGRNFVTLPIEITFIVTLQKLSLFRCTNLQSLPEGELPI